jgi:hypothetical protein
MKLYTTAGLLVLVLAMAGCKINSDFSNTRYRCDMSGECPGGFACVAGYCEVSQAGEDAGVDPDGGALNNKCGTVEMAVEDFEAAEIDEEKWDSWVDNAALSVEHRGGQLAFDFPAGSSEGSGYYTQNAYGFRGGRAYIEVVDAQADSDVGLYFWIEMDGAQDDRWFMRQRGGTLSFINRVDGDDFNIGSISYDPVAHRWWQLREKDGIVYWETSSDAVSWTSHAMVPVDVTEKVQVMISTWLDAAEETPRTLLVDNINGGVDPGIRWCPAATFKDGFDDGVMHPEWKFWEWPDNLCTMHEQEGKLSFAFAAGDYSQCGYYSAAPFDLSDSTYVIEAPPADVGDMTIYFAVYAREGEPRDFMEFRQGGGTLAGAKSAQGSQAPTFEIPFDPVQHRWWRLRGEDGTGYWETSSDGKTWTTHASHSSPPLQLDEVGLDLWGDSNGGVDNIGNGFDNMNLAPAP